MSINELITLASTGPHGKCFKIQPAGPQSIRAMAAKGDRAAANEGSTIPQHQAQEAADEPGGLHTCYPCYTISYVANRVGGGLCCFQQIRL